MIEAEMVLGGEKIDYLKKVEQSESLLEVLKIILIFKTNDFKKEKYINWGMCFSRQNREAGVKEIISHAGNS